MAFQIKKKVNYFLRKDRAQEFEINANSMAVSVILIQRGARSSAKKVGIS